MQKQTPMPNVNDRSNPTCKSQAMLQFIIQSDVSALDYVIDKHYNTDSICVLLIVLGYIFVGDNQQL